MLSYPTKYVLDANVFIEAARRYYAFDIAKPFWDGLTNYAKKGELGSIDKVKDEIQKGNDDLKKWAESDFAKYFYSTQQSDLMNSYMKLVQWVQVQKQYTQKAKDIFMESNNADTYAIAFSLAYNLILVTHEVLSPEAQKRIPIPNVCEAFGIQYCDTFEMLRDMGFSF